MLSNTTDQKATWFFWLKIYLSQTWTLQNATYTNLHEQLLDDKPWNDIVSGLSKHRRIQVSEMSDSNQWCQQVGRFDINVLLQVLTVVNRHTNCTSNLLHLIKHVRVFLLMDTAEIRQTIKHCSQRNQRGGPVQRLTQSHLLAYLVSQSSY